MEDVTQDPISKADLKLRSVLYGIVLAAGRRPAGVLPVQVAEFSRSSGGTQVEEIKVPALRSLPPHFETLPNLGDIGGMHPRLRYKLFLHVLDSLGSVEHLPIGWQFPVATLRHWLCVSQRVSNTPPIHKRHLLVILAGMLRASPDEVGPRHKVVHHEKNFSNLQRFHAMRPHPHTEVPAVDAAMPVRGKLDVSVIHIFNQWQRIVRCFAQLNSILCYPLPGPRLHQMFNGALAYQTYTDKHLDDNDILIKTPLSDSLYTAVISGLESVLQEASKAGTWKDASQVSAFATSAASVRARLEKQSLENAFKVPNIKGDKEEDEEEEMPSDELTSVPVPTLHEYPSRARGVSAHHVGGRQVHWKSHRK